MGEQKSDVAAKKKHGSFIRQYRNIPGRRVTLHSYEGEDTDSFEVVRAHQAMLHRYLAKYAITYDDAALCS